MKSRFSFVLGICGVACAIASTSSLGQPGERGRPDHAGPPDFVGSCDVPAKDGSEGPPGKVLIAHCGCNEEGTDLVLKHITVSTNAKGHLRHKRYDDLDPRETGCEAIDTEGSTVEILHKRAADDCRLVVDDNDNNIGSGVGLADCAIEPAPAIGESCSIDGPQEIPVPENTVED